ncbi:hypothetical protein NMY22_g13039 [Coprinellus aureogranulatus]|nr:hypothetical protein NMY22_g13039 [Coprinellus aureogranulatus]
MSSDNESPVTSYPPVHEGSDYEEYTGPVFADEEHDSDLSSEDASDISEDEPIFPLPNSDPREESNPQPTRENTRMKKENLNEEMIYQAVRKTCYFMEGQRIDLAIFLDALSWGNRKCIGDPKVREQRTSWLHSEELAEVLKRWHSPPRTGTKPRPAGAKVAMEEWAVETVSNLITQELKALGPLLRLPAGKDVDADELTGLGLAEMRDIMKAKAPVFWKILNDVPKARRLPGRSLP